MFYKVAFVVVGISLYAGAIIIGVRSMIYELIPSIARWVFTHELANDTKKAIVKGIGLLIMSCITLLIAYSLISAR